MAYWLIGQERVWGCEESETTTGDPKLGQTRVDPFVTFLPLLAITIRFR